MNTMVFTHNLNEKCVRRFFVNPSMRNLIRMIELEIWGIDRTKSRSLSSYHAYVKMRIQTLYLADQKDFIDLTVLEAHLLDCADVHYYRLWPKPYPFTMPHRMYKYSEILPINKERGNSV